MNANRDADQILHAWLEEGPTRLPDPTARAIEVATRTMPQQRPVVRWPWRIPSMNPRLGLAAAVIALVAVGLGGWYLLAPPRPNPSVGGPTTPSPSASPTPSAASAIAAGFVRPFEYRIPAGSTLGVEDPLANTAFQIREPDRARGVIVRAVAGGRSDPCSESSDAIELAPGAAAVLTYLRSVPNLDVAAEVSTTVDGRPALSVDIVARTPVNGCADLYLWSDGVAFTNNLPPGQPARLTIVDIDGDHIVFITYAPELAAWLETADAVIDSVRFTPASPSSSPG